MTNFIFGALFTGVVMFAIVQAWRKALLWKSVAETWKDKYDDIYNKDPNELDLMLATSQQLIAELRKRPKVQYILMTPKFNAKGVEMDVEVHNMTPEVASKILRTAGEVTAKAKKRNNND